MAYIVMAIAVMAYMAMVNWVMAFIAMAYVVMGYVAIAYVVMAHITAQHRRERCVPDFSHLLVPITISAITI